MSFNNYLRDLQHYDIIKKHATLSGKLCNQEIEDITFLSYLDLKETIPELFQKGDFEKAMHIIFKKKLTFRRIKREKNSRKLIFLLWLKEQYKQINELEEQYLYTPPEAKLLQAGIKELDILGDKNTIDSLAGGDVLKWDLVKQLPYSVVFDKLLKNTIESRINKRLVEINKQK